MRTIMVLNAKGGSGKTTLVTNIAGYYASQGKTTVIKDYDPQGSSTDWLEQRGYSLPKIHGLTAFKPASQYRTRAWQMRLPTNTDRVIIDTPAAVDLKRFVSTFRDVDKILIPVSNSAIEIRATAKFIQELKTFFKLYPCKAQIGIVANRVDTDSSEYHSMVSIFKNLELNFIASLSRNSKYLKGAERGVSLLELEHPQLARDKFEWAPMINWLEDEWVMVESAEETKLYAVTD